MANSIKFMNEGFDAKYGSIKPDLCEEIYNVLKRLTEANMSPEDERDTKLLYSIYDKIKERDNAKLTPEEQSVLKKYNIQHLFSMPTSWGGKYVSGINNEDGKGGYDLYKPVNPANMNGHVNRNVNLADRARKAGQRKKSKQGIGKYDADYQVNYRHMGDNVLHRNAYKKQVDHLNKLYDDEELELRKKLATLKSRREMETQYSQQQVDSYNSKINKLLKRESLDKSNKNVNIDEIINYTVPTYGNNRINPYATLLVSDDTSKKK